MVILTEHAGVVGLPGTLDGFPVLLRVTGVVRALHHECGHVHPRRGPGDCSPGITVSPTSGLETTEAGGTDTFIVVLDAAPSAPVTVPISSSNTDEGVVDTASLIFTANDWDAAQEVTVTGVNDEIVDGDVVYEVVVGSASSVDLNYNEIDPADVSVTNLDDDGAPVDGADCFSTGETTVRCDQPFPIGVSIGHPSVTAGTFGMRVTDGTDVFILSNNHVLANENLATIGDNILQPGTFDGGVEPVDSVGTLFAFVTIDFSMTANNVVDAAIALSDTATIGNSTPDNGYGTPRSETVDAFPGQRLRKYGRTTDQTNGRVFAINVDLECGLRQRRRAVRGPDHDRTRPVQRTG